MDNKQLILDGKAVLDLADRLDGRAQIKVDLVFHHPIKIAQHDIVFVRAEVTD